MPKFNPIDFNCSWTQLSLNDIHCPKLINFYILRKAFDFYLKSRLQKKPKDLFVRQFVDEVIRNKRNYYAIDKINVLRTQLKRNYSKIQHIDFGAGSQFNSKERTISSFLRHSSSDEYKGKVLFHLSRHFRAQCILELGTNLGIGTAYLASANSKSMVKSLEGCPNLSLAAKNILTTIGIKNVEVVTGRFSETLFKTCQKLKKIDLVYIDGNHNYQATIENYKTINPFLHKKSIVVFDDIYWSTNMTKAWNEIKKDNSITLCIDLFKMGIVFFDDKITKGSFKFTPELK